jgi:hypothetical protein
MSWSHRGRNEIRGFVGLEHRGSLFRLSRDPLCVREAIGHPGEKLAGEVLSGCDGFGHRSSR